MKNILITGGNGFVGSHLVNRTGGVYNLTVFDNVKRDAWWEDKATWRKGDLIDYADVELAVDNMDGVVHLGAISRVKEAKDNPLRCMNVNVMGTINILEAVRNTKKKPWVILGSTIEPLSNIYGLSKHISELCGKRYVEDYGLRVLALKFSSIYGKYERDRVISKWIEKAVHNQDIVIDNSKSTFDFIHVDDIVDGIVFSMEYIENVGKGFSDSIFLCTGKATNLLELSELIIKEINSKSGITVIDVYNEENYLPNPKKAEELLGFKPKIDISEGIKKTTEQFLVGKL